MTVRSEQNVRKPKLLVVEDNEALRTQMKWALAQEYDVFVASSRQEALDLMSKENPPVLTLDLGLPPDPDGVTEGFETLSEILHHQPLSKVIIITGRTEKEHALKAIAQGAYDLFIKPIDVEELKIVLRRAFYLANLESEYKRLQRDQTAAASFHGLLGDSRQMQKLFEDIRKVATTDAIVLIQGESGTGKEMVARAIHALSNRRNGPFVAINCGAIPENLLESELFGYEKGAFTGAVGRKEGHIQSAHKGTLFLDEIGDLPILLQVKILRFLQDSRIVRLGARTEISVDTRVIAATNTDLQKAIKEGRFREDLFYRLSVITLSLPPLREREGDVMLLAKSFLHKFANEIKKPIKGFHPQAVKLMQTHHWPGNVRELENRVKRAVIMSDGQLLTPTDLEFESGFSPYVRLGLKEARDALERSLVEEALRRNEGNISQAAKELNISRPTLYELMDKHDIRKT